MRLRRSMLAVAAAAWLCPAGAARASWQSCGGKPIDETQVRCPDGGIPSFMTGDPPATGPAASAPVKTQVGVFGIWHTDRPGTAYRNGVDVPGAYALGTSPGLAAGDLTIGESGNFVWNTDSALSGPWIPFAQRGESASRQDTRVAEATAPKAGPAPDNGSGFGSADTAPTNALLVLLDQSSHQRWVVSLVEDGITISDGRTMVHGHR